jgi:sugar fermentation stimulation protein A
MRFASPLIPATLVRRYKRFLADVVLGSGEIRTVHVANPGAMIGLSTPGARIFVSQSSDTRRKLGFSWELVEVDLGSGPELVGVNTSYPNALVFEAMAARRIPELNGYSVVRREVRYAGNCRIDFLLESPDRPPCYLEVKNVHLMRQPRLAEFPDAVTARGSKHLAALIATAAAGARAIMLFVVQIGSADRFTLARDIDPRYAQALDRARQAGVEALAWRCQVSAEGISVARPVPIVD